MREILDPKAASRFSAARLLSQASEAMRAGFNVTFSVDEVKALLKHIAFEGMYTREERDSYAQGEISRSQSRPGDGDMGG